MGLEIPAIGHPIRHQVVSPHTGTEYKESAMAYLTTQPAELTAAAAILEGVNTVMASQSMAVATPTTGVIPAAADQVSALQAAQFSAYGTLYQQISAQAQVIHQQIASTLAGSAGSYDVAEAANTQSTGLIGTLTGMLTGNSTTGLLGSTFGNGALMAVTQAGTFGSAASDLTAGAPGFLTSSEEPQDSATGDDTVLATTTKPIGATGLAAPVAAAGAVGVGHASSVGRLSVPTSWGVQVAAQPNPAAALTGTFATASEGAPLAGVPAGMPAGAAGQDNSGIKSAKYAVKAKLLAAQPAV